jgi:hypothetical protein
MKNAHERAAEGSIDVAWNTPLGLGARSFTALRMAVP